MPNREKRFKYDAMLLGERIAMHRSQARMTQEQLAKKLDVSVASVSHIENGKMVCDLNLLVGLANAFEVDLCEMLRGVVLMGVDSSSYLTKEIATEFEGLTISEKRFVHGVIKLLRQEHQRGLSDDDI